MLYLTHPFINIRYAPKLEYTHRPRQLRNPTDHFRTSYLNRTRRFPPHDDWVGCSMFTLQTSATGRFMDVLRYNLNRAPRQGSATSKLDGRTKPKPKPDKSRATSPPIGALALGSAIREYSPDVGEITSTDTRYTKTSLARETTSNSPKSHRKDSPQLQYAHLAAFGNKLHRKTPRWGQRAL